MSRFIKMPDGVRVLVGGTSGVEGERKFEMTEVQAKAKAKEMAQKKKSGSKEATK